MKLKLPSISTSGLICVGTFVFGSLMQPVEANEDLKYMSEAIYFEARDQAIIGQVAVGCTIMNRVNKKNWPNTIREVVHQPHQFSYYNDGKPETIDDEKAHYIAWTVAENVINSNVCDMFNGMDHYINESISPAKWFESMEFIMEVGDHTFYRRDENESE